MSSEREHRIVALGDSLIAGVGDPYPDGSPRGFADLLVNAMHGADSRVRYANLSRPSVRVAEVLAGQVAQAAAFRPTLVLWACGANDVIAWRCSVDAVAAAFVRSFDTLLAGGGLVVALTLPLPARHGPLSRLLQGRVRAINAALRDAADAQQTGTVLVDLERVYRPSPGQMAPDGVHPGPHGHLAIARILAARLGFPPPHPHHLQPPARLSRLVRMHRTVRAAPRFVAKRLDRRTITAQGPKHVELRIPRGDAPCVPGAERAGVSVAPFIR